MDPELLLWVQVTLVWTSVQAYGRWVEPLDAADREELWAEAREVGRRLGIPLEVSPPDWAALEAYWDRMLAPDGPIAITPTARRLAASIIRPPIIGPPGRGHRPAGDTRPGAPSGADPRRLWRAMGPVPRSRGPRRESSRLRLWVGRMPPAWRSMPQARAADRRVRAVGRADGASLQSTGPAPQEPTARA